MEQPAQGNRAKLRIGVAAALLATAVIILTVLNQRQPTTPVANLPAPPPSNFSSADTLSESSAPLTVTPPAEAETNITAESTIAEPPPPPVVGALPAPIQPPASPPNKAAEANEPPFAQTKAVVHAAAAKTFEVQLGVFTDLENARQLQARLTQQGIASHSETRVQVGPFKTRAEADQARNRLKALGLNPVIIAE